MYNNISPFLHLILCSILHAHYIIDVYTHYDLFKIIFVMMLCNLGVDRDDTTVTPDAGHNIYRSRSVRLNGQTSTA
jgi:hypothetical protein